MLADFDHARLEAVKRIGWMKFPMHLRLLQEKHEREKSRLEAEKAKRNR